MSRQFDDLQIGTIELFCLAVEQGSFAGAAVVAGVSPAAISRSISRLEARLSVRLFARTTRQINLTEAGRAYYARCRRSLDELLEAENELAGKRVEPEGVLRVSLPVPYGHLRILPLLPDFRARYPRICIDANLSNRNIDFVSEGFDLAVRARKPPDSNLIARKIEDAELVVAASPAYLQRTGTPLHLDHLADHECLQFQLPSSGQMLAWSFHDRGTDIEVSTRGHYSCSEDLGGVVTLAKHGAGLVQIYRFMIADELKAGSLVEVLQPYGGRSRPFSLLYPANRYLPLRVRVFIDFMMERFPAPVVGQ